MDCGSDNCLFDMVVHRCHSKKKSNQRRYGFIETIILLVVSFYACFIVEYILKMQATINQIASYDNKVVVAIFEDLKKLPLVLGFTFLFLLIFGYKIYKNMNMIFKQDILQFAMRVKNIYPKVLDLLGLQKKK